MAELTFGADERSAAEFATLVLKMSNTDVDRWLRVGTAATLRITSISTSKVANRLHDGYIAFEGKLNDGGAVAVSEMSHVLCAYKDRHIHNLCFLIFLIILLFEIGVRSFGFDFELRYSTRVV